MVGVFVVMLKYKKRAAISDHPWKDIAKPLYAGILFTHKAYAFNYILASVHLFYHWQSVEPLPVLAMLLSLLACLLFSSVPVFWLYCNVHLSCLSTKLFTNVMICDMSHDWGFAIDMTRNTVLHQSGDSNCLAESLISFPAKSSCLVLLLSWCCYHPRSYHNLEARICHM